MTTDNHQTKTSPNGGGRRFLDEWECQQVVLRFTAHFDAAEHEAMEQYFAPEAVWHQARGLIRGREQMRERMREMPTDRVMRHVLTNLRTTLVGRDEAIVDSYFTVYLQQQTSDDGAPVPTHGPRNIGRYRDRLLRLGDRWMISERQVMFDLKTLEVAAE